MNTPIRKRHTMKKTIAALAAGALLAAPTAASARPNHWTLRQARAEVAWFERDHGGKELGVTITDGRWLTRGHKAAFTITTKPITLFVGQTNLQRYQWTDIAEPNPGGYWYNVWAVGFTQPGPINIG